MTDPNDNSVENKEMKDFKKWTDLIAQMTVDYQMGGITDSTYRANMRIAVMGMNDFKFDDEGNVTNDQP